MPDKNCTKNIDQNKPIIGITADCKKDDDHFTGGQFELSWKYVDAINTFGGIPILIPYQEDCTDILSIIDGWLIAGGLDLHPDRYSESYIHPENIHQDNHRYHLEEKLYSCCHEEMPILGICYGCQFLNIINGGTLHQHLPDIKKLDLHHLSEFHEHTIIEESKLHHALSCNKIIGESYHHQGINQVAENFAVTAYHEDGTIEGIEHKNRSWILGVQWHAERSLKYPENGKLFKTFINKARNYKYLKSISK